MTKDPTDVLSSTLSPLRLAALCGLIGPPLGLGLVLAAVARSPWFSWQTNALSDLGVNSAALLFNGGVILAGLLTLGLAWGVWQALAGPSVLARVGTGILGLGGLCLALVGVFTEDTPAIHTAVALGYFIFFPVGLLLLGGSWLRPPERHERRGQLTLVAGVAALVAIFGIPREGLAIPEIVEASILAAWTVGAGTLLWRLSAGEAGDATVEG